MKRLLLILILLLPRLAAAQSNSVDDFFSRYAAAEGFTSVQLEQKMMQLMSRQAAERGDKGLAVLLKDIQYIRIIALKEGDGGRFVRDAEAAVAADRKFQPVTSGSENGQTTKFYIRETALSVKSELVMITYGAKETVVVNIFGVFDLRQVARLHQAVAGMKSRCATDSVAYFFSVFCAGFRRCMDDACCCLMSGICCMRILRKPARLPCCCRAGVCVVADGIPEATPGIFHSPPGSCR